MRRVRAGLGPADLARAGEAIAKRVLEMPQVTEAQGVLCYLSVRREVPTGPIVAALREAGVRRLAVGVGMVPRGEVGLIFAAIGSTTLVAGAPLLDAGTYAALVLLVMATTLVTPPSLARTLGGITGAGRAGG